MSDTEVVIETETIRAVLCDDVAEIRVLMRFTLEEDEGIEVVGEAADGESGLAAVLDTGADAILLDLSMPGMDGFEAIQRLRERSPQTAIVVLSGFPEARLGDAAIALGADRYLEKGEPGEVIRGAILEVVEAKRAANSS